MSDYATVDPYLDKADYVLNRAPLYRDRQFIIQPGAVARLDNELAVAVEGPLGHGSQRSS